MRLLKLRHDLVAGLIVFLVAMPLCLGIALASGANLMAGIWGGIIGGVVIGILSGSHTAVSGPAAGLATIVLMVITDLHDYHLFLAAVIIAGFIQVFLGAFKAGIIADYIPSSVIKGLLIAIGIILILKQIPHALGIDSDPEGDTSFYLENGRNTFTELLYSITRINPGITIVSLFCLAILFLWNRIPNEKIRNIPSVLIVVIFAVVLNQIFILYFPSLAIHQNHLVNLPQVSFNSAFQYIENQSFFNFLHPKVWLYAIVIAFVASLNTLININAVDKIDIHKRHSPPNRELVAQGIGNILCGLLGGIPVALVVVRSVVNVTSKSESKFSTIVHGMLMFLSVLFFKEIINLIPLAALAAILIYTGINIASRKVFQDMYNKGWNQFIPFIITVLAIVFTDLLLGVFVGLTAGMYFVMRDNYYNAFVNEDLDLHIGKVVRLELQSQATFLNKATIKNELWDIPPDSKVIIDATKTNYIDYDVMEIIEDYKNVYAPEHNIQLNIYGMKDKYEANDYIQFINVLDKDTQDKLQPEEVLNLLKTGNERYVNGKYQKKYYTQQINATSLGQNPMAIVLTCVESRTTPEMIFDTGVGDLLTIRIAANIISNDVLGTMELAVSKLNAKLIVVVGHSSCGAVKNAVVNDNSKSYIQEISDKIEKAIKETPENTNSEEDYYDAISKQNARNSVIDIIEKSQLINEKIKDNKIGIVSAYQDIQTGIVTFDEIRKFE